MKKAYESPMSSVYECRIQSNILESSPNSELGSSVNNSEPGGAGGNDPNNNFSRDASTSIWDQEW